MSHPIPTLLRPLGAAFAVFALLSSPLAAQQSTVAAPSAEAQPQAETEEEMEALIAAHEQEVYRPPSEILTAEERADQALELAKLEPINPALILSDNAAIDTYRAAYANAQAAAQAIYDARDAFDALRALTPAEAEEMFPDGGYDVALNAASDAHYWAIEDGAAAATDLAEARSRVVGGRALTPEQIYEVDALLGL